jgi:hypothetical protein
LGEFRHCTDGWNYILETQHNNDQSGTMSVRVARAYPGNPEPSPRPSLTGVVWATTSDVLNVVQAVNRTAGGLVEYNFIVQRDPAPLPTPSWSEPPLVHLTRIDMNTGEQL